MSRYPDYSRTNSERISILRKENEQARLLALRANDKDAWLIAHRREKVLNSLFSFTIQRVAIPFLHPHRRLP